MLSQDELKKLTTYDPHTGIFTWKHRENCANPFWNDQNAGKPAGRTHKGYVQISFGKKRYSAHRLAILYTTGKWPSGCVDHINRDKSDNRISNLRDVTLSANQHNRNVSVNSVSGLIGAHWSARDKRWRSSITVSNKMYHLGSFATREDAHVAYMAAKRRMHIPAPET